MPNDNLAQHNRTRWNALVEAGIEFSRPLLDLDETAARAVVDQQGLLGEIRGREVLCLAAGGGQQSAAFGLLGAQVTVLDLADEMLRRDREAADHYGLSPRLEQGDMRDLGRFADHSFDVVWHAYSINFVPDVRPVLAEVARVLRPQGWYRLQLANPFALEVDETSWNGRGYTINTHYADKQVYVENPYWDIENAEGEQVRVEGPHEFRHTLSTIVNNLVANSLAIQGVWEAPEGDATAAPGTWLHFVATLPPWLTIWAKKL